MSDIENKDPNGSLLPNDGAQPDGAEREGVHFTTGDLRFFAAGEVLGTPEDPSVLPVLAPDEVVPVSPEELARAAAEFHDNNAAIAARRRSGEFPAVGRRRSGEFPAVVPKPEQTDVTDPGFERPDLTNPSYAGPQDPQEVTSEPLQVHGADSDILTLERAETPRTLESVKREENGEEEGPTKALRALIIHHLKEVDNLFIIMARNNRELFFSTMDPSNVQVDASDEGLTETKDADGNLTLSRRPQHLIKTLAARLFDDPEIDRSKYFPNIHTAADALKVFETKTLSSCRLFDLLQLTIRKKIDINYVEPYIDGRINHYLKGYCMDLISKLAIGPIYQDEKAKKVKDCLTTKVNTRKDLDDLVNKTFIKYYSEHSYALFAEYLSLIYQCTEDEAKIQLESNIYKVIQEKFKYDLDRIFNTIQHLKREIAEENAERGLEAAFAPAAGAAEPAAPPPPAEAASLPLEPSSSQPAIKPVIGGRSHATLKGIGPGSKLPDIEIVLNPLNGNASQESVQGELHIKKDAEKGEKESGPAQPVGKVLITDVPDKEKPLPAMIDVEGGSQAKKIIVSVAAGIALVVFGLTGYLYNKKSVKIPKEKREKVAFNASKDSGFHIQNNDASLPAETKLADASIQAAVAEQVDAALSAPQADAAVLADSKAPKPVEDKTLTMPLTKESIPVIAKTEQGRERLRKIALNDAGEVILNAQNPLYNYLGLHLIYQQEDVPHGQALFLNKQKLVNKEGVWYLETGKRAFYYTGDKLSFMRID